MLRLVDTGLRQYDESGRTRPVVSCLCGNDGEWDAGNVGPRTALPLWIADQVRNDVMVVPGRPHLVVSRLRGNDGPTCRGQ